MASLAPKNFEEARRLVVSVPAGAGAIEWRLDLAATRLSQRALLDLDPRPAIMTHRTVREGGRFSGSAEEYRRAVESAYAAGAAVDVEIESGLLASADFLPDRSRVIASRHGPLPRAASRWDELLSVAAAAVKVVGPEPGRVEENAECLAALGRRRGALACFLMGARGLPSRILGSRYGSALTYAGVGEATAAGQLSIADFLGAYGAFPGEPPERLFLVYGRDVSGSLSPRIHNALFRRRRLPHLLIPVSASEASRDGAGLLSDARSLAPEAGGPAVSGIAVTNPFKAACLNVAIPDEVAREVGAANTLVVAPGSPGELRAHNTDAEAVAGVLAEEAPGARRVLVIGTGGAAAAALFAARRRGCEAAVAGRSLPKSQALAARFGAAALTLASAGEAEADVVVHATPLGASSGEPAPVPPALLSRRPLVVDFVYRADGPTALIAAARQAGCPAVEGRELLARQAVPQAERFGVSGATLAEAREAAFGGAR